MRGVRASERNVAVISGPRQSPYFQTRRSFEYDRMCAITRAGSDLRVFKKLLSSEGMTARLYTATYHISEDEARFSGPQPVSRAISRQIPPVRCMFFKYASTNETKWARGSLAPTRYLAAA